MGMKKLKKDKIPLDIVFLARYNMGKGLLNR